MKYLPDLFAITGFGLLAYGLYLINLPLSLCVSGTLLIVVALILARNGNDIKQAIPEKPTSPGQHATESGQQSG